jgi:hypothetical protein
LDARARRLLVSQAPLDQVPGFAFLPALTAVLGPGAVLAQRVSPDASAAAASTAARAIAALPEGLPRGQWRWPLAEATSCAARLALIAPALGETRGLYFSVRWGTLGALRTDPATVMPHAVALAGQSLGCLFTSLTGEMGLRLDLVNGDPALPGSGTFELIVWGKQWLRAAQDAMENAPTA